MHKRFWYLLCFLLLIPIIAACGQSGQNKPSQAINSDSISIDMHATPTPGLAIAQQVAPTPTPATDVPPTSSGPAPYGQPPDQTALESQLTQQLFNQINQDRAARGLYAYTWNATLAGGARLHSWNMYNCGQLSHTCPNGEDQCVRIASEGFQGYSDCGENIAESGPSNPAWTKVYAIQEQMINEPPDGWHRIHLTSTTLHRVGVGVYVAPNGWVWFTEDFVS